MTVFFDVDTQLDFLFPAGALYVPSAEKLLPQLGRLTSFAGKNGIPLISTMDAHTENDPEFRHWPPHCVAGTLGQRKAETTLLARAEKQLFIEKQSVDCFTSIRLAEVLQELQASRYVVYGVVTEICVKHAVLGLLKTGAEVVLVEDAIRELKETSATAMLTEFQARGGRLATVDQITS